MHTKQIATFLQTVQLFHELSPEQLNQLAQHTREVRFSAGQSLSEAGEHAESLVVLVESECVEYIKPFALGTEVQLRRLYPGDYFGIETIVAEKPAAARRIAQADGRALLLAKPALDDLFNESPVFARAVCQALARRAQQIEELAHGIRYVNLSEFPNIGSLLHLLPRRIASVSRSLAVEQNADRVTVAMVNPSDIRARSFIESVLSDYHVQFAAISEEDFEKNGRKLLGETINANGEDKPFDRMLFQDSDGVLRPMRGSREDDLLSRLLTVALRRGASDVHFEPYREAARVRLRVDGRMVTLDEHITAATFRQLLSRIKVLSELDTTRIRRPQDGRFLIEADDHPIEFRVSASPCHGGEKVVLRVIAPNVQHSDLGRLILHSPMEHLARELFRSPSGLVLVTGPSGAGKTTTLYAALKSVIGRDVSKNVVTIEDPVEYDLPFATQIQVHYESGMDFATVLKSVLRQDPDVILVGEIRDQESAARAAEAATTGHLVLSSLHTYSALEAIVRLRDLQVPPYVIAAALRGVITQQLVPRLDPAFTEEVPPDDPIVQQLRELEVLPEFWTQRLLRGRESVEGPPGGEQGRVAVFEMFSVTPELSAAIDGSASLQEMKEALDPGSFGTFVDYARFLMHEGIVAPERILETLPRGAARIRYDAGHHHGTAQHAPSYWSDKMSANPPGH